MTATGDTPDGADLAELRTEIDELKQTPEEQLVSPLPQGLRDQEPVPFPTDAIGSEDWEKSARP